MKEKIFTLNGLTIDGILLCVNLNMTKHFYSQGRIMLTDNNNNEIRSIDILDIMKNLNN